MLTVPQAWQLVMAQAVRRPAALMSLAESLGLVLAEDVAADVDSPPHDKAMVDGYAIVAGDLASGTAELAVVEEITAGQTPTRPVQPGSAARIMTGAPIPSGADAVVMIERATSVAPDRVRLVDRPATTGQNILPRGSSFSRGATLLRTGAVLRAIEIGILAEIGRPQVRVTPRPCVAVLATGNELVDVSQSPAAGQIRNSNGPLLTAAVQQAGGMAIPLGVARDERGELQAKVEQGLAADMLLVSGGVSAGVLDLAPEVLRELGVREIFHKVRLKPGKPLWFGVREWSDASRPATLVFGLPGNPVGSFVCFELFVRAAVRMMAGRTSVWSDGQAMLQARLTVAWTHRGDRPTYHPARLHCHADGVQVEPLPWHGSADLAALATATALAHFPAGDHAYQPGDTVEVHRLAEAT